MATKPMSNKEKQRLRAERAAAALKEKQRRERRRQILTVVGVVVALALVVGGGFVINSMRDDTKETAAKIPPPGSQYGLTIGPASAPHKVVVYEDFLCPFCGEFEKASHEQLAQLADRRQGAGRVPPVRPPERLGPYSARATMIWWLVLEKYGDDVAKKFHDLLYANQPSEEGPFPSQDDLVRARRPGRGQRRRAQDGVENDEGVGRWPTPRRARRTSVSTAPRPSPSTESRSPDGATAADLAANLIKAVQ